MNKAIFAVLRCTLFTLAIMLFCTSAVFAQTPAETSEGFLPIAFDFSSFAATFAGFATGSTILTECVKKLLKLKFPNLHSLVSLLISWLLPTLAAVALWYQGAGIFNGLSLVNALILGFACALVSNGIFDCVTIVSALECFKKKGSE